MKELSIEQKAKAYDEAIKYANYLINECCKEGTNGSFHRADLQKMFPELNESEDERIKKTLIKYFRNCVSLEGINGEDISNWLEKQGEQKSDDKIQLGKKYKCIASPRYTAFMKGSIYEPKDRFLCSLMNFCSDCFEPIEDGEQKPAEEYNITGIGSKNAQGKLGEMIKNLKSTDKVEPKFKIGDWIIRSAENFEHNKYLITEIRDCYVCEDLKDRRVTFTFNDVHKNFKLWDISDAKEGDVLVASDGSIFLFKGTIDGACKHYVALTTDSVVKFNEGLEHYWETSTAVHPATKEQRDLLFQKMHEAGYEWGAEKKELKKIEQKPANVFNIYEKPLLEKFKQAVYDCAWGKVTCKVEGESQEEYAERWAEQFLLMVRDWADDYIDFTIQQKLRKSYDKGKENTIKEDRSSWSEEDEKMIQDIINDIAIAQEQVYCKSRCEDEINWLKSLEDRVQPKQEWSEEDKAILEKCIGAVKVSCYSQSFKSEAENWLKSLRPQSQWKPSDVQMDAVKDAIDYLGGNTKIVRKHLMSLYDQLKKLREE